MVKLPQYRDCTRTSPLQWAFYGACVLVVVAATVDPTWPKWQAVAMAALLGSVVATSLRDRWWRTALSQQETK